MSEYINTPANVIIPISQWEELMSEIKEFKAILSEKIDTGFKQFITKKEAAQILSCSEKSIDNYIGQKLLKPLLIGGKQSIRFDIEDVYSILKPEQAMKARGKRKGRVSKRGMSNIKK